MKSNISIVIRLVCGRNEQKSDYFPKIRNVHKINSLPHRDSEVDRSTVDLVAIKKVLGGQFTMQNRLIRHCSRNSQMFLDTQATVCYTKVFLKSLSKN